MNFQPFKNQYIISDFGGESHIEGFQDYQIFEKHIYKSKALALTHSMRGNVSVLLLGYVLDPLNPTRSNRDIADHLAASSPDLQRFFKNIEAFSGRFVLIYKNEVDYIVTGDACHFRQIYYGSIDGNFVITSSPRLFLEYFNLPLKSNPLKSEFVKSREFEQSENSWFGDESPDDRLKKLLPNHFLDLNSGKISRLSLSLFRKVY